jgi:hypothetical protein
VGAKPLRDASRDASHRTINDILGVRAWSTGRGQARLARGFPEFERAEPTGFGEVSPPFLRSGIGSQRFPSSMRSLVYSSMGAAMVRYKSPYNNPLTFMIFIAAR